VRNGNLRLSLEVDGEDQILSVLRFHNRWTVHVGLPHLLCLRPRQGVVVRQVWEQALLVPPQLGEEGGGDVGVSLASEVSEGRSDS